jgi:hypothetical protein
MSTSPGRSLGHALPVKADMLFFFSLWLKSYYIAQERDAMSNLTNPGNLQGLNHRLNPFLDHGPQPTPQPNEKIENDQRLSSSRYLVPNTQHPASSTKE